MPTPADHAAKFSIMRIMTSDEEGYELNSLTSLQFVIGPTRFFF